MKLPINMPQLGINQQSISYYNFYLKTVSRILKDYHLLLP